MNRPELIAAISTIVNIDKKQAAAALDAVVTALKDTLCTGESTTIAGLGTFSVKERAARAGRNVRTGEAIQIAAKKVAVFKPAKALKNAVEIGQTYPF